jgi:hypothetical protein
MNLKVFVANKNKNKRIKKHRRNEKEMWLHDQLGLLLLLHKSPKDLRPSRAQPIYHPLFRTVKKLTQREFITHFSEQ